MSKAQQQQQQKTFSLILFILAHWIMFVLLIIPKKKFFLFSYSLNRNTNWFCLFYILNVIFRFLFLLLCSSFYFVAIIISASTFKSHRPKMAWSFHLKSNKLVFVKTRWCARNSTRRDNSFCMRKPNSMNNLYYFIIFYCFFILKLWKHKKIKSKNNLKITASIFFRM